MVSLLLYSFFRLDRGDGCSANVGWAEARHSAEAAQFCARPQLSILLDAACVCLHKIGTNWGLTGHAVGFPPDRGRYISCGAFCRNLDY